VPAPAESLELIKNISAGKIECPEALLLCAPDNIRKQRFCDLVLRNISATNGGDARNALVTFDAASFDARQIVSLRDEVSSLSLFAARRVFIVRNVEELSTPLVESFLKIFEAGLSGVNCICLASKLPASSAILKFFRARNTAVILDPLEGSELTRWIQKELKNSEISDASAEAVDLLAQLGEGSPDRIAHLIAHAALYVESNTLSVKDLRDLFIETHSANEFAFIDALMQRDESRSSSMLQVLLSSGKNPFMLVSLLHRTFSTYLSVAALQREGRSPAQIGEILKLPPWLLKKHLAAVRNYPISQLKRCLECLLRADSLLKNRSLGTESIFSEFIYSVTHRA
jgi:DNA polymerase III delta subunit